MSGENLLIGHDENGREIFIDDLRAEPLLIFKMKNLTEVGEAFRAALSARINLEAMKDLTGFYVITEDSRDPERALAEIEKRMNTIQ